MQYFKSVSREQDIWQDVGSEFQRLTIEQLWRLTVPSHFSILVFSSSFSRDVWRTPNTLHHRRPGVRLSWGQPTRVVLSTSTGLVHRGASFSQAPLRLLISYFKFFWFYEIILIILVNIACYCSHTAAIVASVCALLCRCRPLSPIHIWRDRQRKARVSANSESAISGFFPCFLRPYRFLSAR